MLTHRLSLVVLFSLFLSNSYASIEHHFNKIKSNSIELTQFFKEMPKGGELHYHLAGAASPKTMLALAAVNQYCLNKQTNDVTKTTKPCEGIKTTQITPNTPLYQQVVQAWSMQNFTGNQQAAHDHFFATFQKFTPIVFDNRPQLLAETLKKAASQHELYMEIMTLPDNAHSTTFASTIEHFKHFSEKKQHLLSLPAFQKNINHTIKESRLILEKARQILHCKTQPKTAACQIKVKFQYYVLREQPLDNVFAQALNGFAAASNSSDIVSVNLVQAEDGPISMRDYDKHMQVFKFLHQNYPEVSISLHAGEILPQQSHHHAKTHIYDAIFTGHAKRIGHGVDILSEDNATSLLDYMAKKSIPVEVNLTSNKTILDVAGIRHPLAHYLTHHVPIVLSTDDEGILQTNLTHEYVIAVLEHHLDYATIKTINRNTLTYGFLPGKSIWLNAQKNIRVPACKHFSSRTCQHFIHQSEKAKLQLLLEKKLAKFEKKYT